MAMTSWLPSKGATISWSPWANLATTERLTFSSKLLAHEDWGDMAAEVLAEIDTERSMEVLG